MSKEILNSDNYTIKLFSREGINVTEASEGDIVTVQLYCTSNTYKQNLEIRNMQDLDNASARERYLTLSNCEYMENSFKLTDLNDVETEQIIDINTNFLKAFKYDGGLRISLTLKINFKVKIIRNSGEFFSIKFFGNKFQIWDDENNPNKYIANKEKTFRFKISSNRVEKLFLSISIFILILLIIYLIKKSKKKNDRKLIKNLNLINNKK